MTWLVWVFIPVGVLGAALFVLGWRGRRVNDHPYCRKCGFDLFGTPDVESCPECGRDLTHVQAIVVGRRRRRRGLAGTGAVLLALALLFGGAGGWLAFSGMNLQSHKPVWWLSSELSSPTDQLAAVTELTDRLNTGKLNEGHIATIVARVLTIQADNRQKWLYEFGDFIETTRAKGLIDDTTFARYLEQGVVFTLTVRPRVRLGDALGYREEFESRLGSGSANLPRFRLDFFQKQFVLSEHVGVMGGGGRGPLGGAHRGSSSGSVSFAALTAGTLPVGRHRIEVKLHARVSDGAFVHEWDVTPASTVQVISPETRTVTSIDDMAIAAQVHQSVSVRNLQMRHYGERWHLDLTLGIDQRPVGLAHRIVVIMEGKRHELGSFSVPGGGNTWWGVGTLLDGPLNASTVDVILEPDIDAAHRSVDVFDMWNRPIEFENVPVEVEPPRE